MRKADEWYEIAAGFKRVLMIEADKEQGIKGQDQFEIASQKEDSFSSDWI